MSMSKIRRMRYIVFLKALGRVIAIHPVVKHSEAEKWQKMAYLETIWVYHPFARLRTYERVRVVRAWYAARARWERVGVYMHGDGRLEIATQSDVST